MIVTAMLAWFNERPDDLHRAVSSAGNLADQVIALDGGWDLYPGAEISSPPEQRDAIREAAHDAGITAHIYPANRIWTGQVEKRNLMLFLAQNTGADWLMPLDADWEIHGDRNAIRAELEHTTADAIIVPFHTPINPDADLDDVAAHQWHKDLAGQTVYEPLIFRALPGIRVEQHHWIYTAFKNGNRVALWGNPGCYPQANTTPLKARMRIDHHCFYREHRTIEANRTYCQQRAEYVAAHGREP